MKNERDALSDDGDRQSLVIELSVPTLELTKCLNRIDTSSELSIDDVIFLYCSDGRFILRQGALELSASCVGHFDGAYVISRTSCRKWQRSLRIEGRGAKFLVEIQRPNASDATALQFSKNDVAAGTLRLPVKWQESVPSLPFMGAKLAIHCEANAPRHPINGSRKSEADVIAVPIAAPKKPSTDKMCVDFRVNLSTDELINALRKCASLGPVTGIQMRTWNGMLIFTCGQLELRVTNEGFIRGRAMFRTEDVPRLAALESDGSRFISLNCEKGRLRILGQTFQLLTRGVPLESPHQSLSEQAAENHVKVQNSVDIFTAIPENIKSPVQLVSESVQPAESKKHQVDTPQISSLLSILRFASSATEDQIRDAGLEEIVAAAYSTRDRLIRQAVESLRLLEISEEQLRVLLNTSLHEIAERAS
jgi:hypothetical protein